MFPKHAFVWSAVRSMEHILIQLKLQPLLECRDVQG